MELFTVIAEPHLIQTTFITEFPKEVSPLACASDNNEVVTDQFEFYVVGQEWRMAFQS